MLCFLTVIVQLVLVRIVKETSQIKPTLMRIAFFIVATSLMLIAIPSYVFSQFNGGDIKLLKAKEHPMQYYVALPNKWNNSRQWPLIIIFESAEKAYKENLDRFVAARGDLPFVIVAPIHTNNGNQGRRDVNIFPYSVETWDYIDKVGDCAFNDEGIKNIVTDVQKQFNTEGKYFVTGFEAGAHMVWQLVFNHPEDLRAAAPVAGNYRGRCITEAAVSTNGAKKDLAVKGFSADNDESFGPKGVLYIQWQEAKEFAKKNGFENISETVVPAKGHVPLTDEVLSYFSSLLN
jgi:poly(3-hydroxybutyrate) depolymerase